MDERDYDAQLDALYAAITGRQSFSYRADQDPLYQAWAQRYIQNGRLAMRDTMGQAAALTGGYGSSYAQAAGQQQYDEYLRALSEALPQFYGMAWEQYQAQGQQLRDAYDLSFQLRADDYARQQDAEQARRQGEAEAYQRRQAGYQQLYQLISATGYVPGDEELQQAGMSRERAEALYRAWDEKHHPAVKTQTIIYRGGSGKKSQGGTQVVKPSQQAAGTQPVKTSGASGGTGRRADALK